MSARQAPSSWDVFRGQVIARPEKRKVSSSILPLTTTLTSQNARTMIAVRAFLGGAVSVLVSFALPEIAVQPVRDVAAKPRGHVGIALHHRAVGPAHDVHDGTFRDAE